MAAITAGICGSRSGLSNSRISAPAMKLLPSPIRTSACSAGSAPADCTAASNPLRTSQEAALTGGLSMMRTATPSSLSTRTAVMSVQRADRGGELIEDQADVAFAENKRRRERNGLTIDANDEALLCEGMLHSGIGSRAKSIGT